MVLSRNSSVFNRINSSVRKAEINACCRPQIYKIEKNNNKNSVAGGIAFKTLCFIVCNIT